MRERVGQATWARRRTDEFPRYVAAEMLRQHSDRVGIIGPHSTSPWYEANQWLVGAQKELQREKLWEAFDESDIRDFAENFAKLCAEMPQLAERELFALARNIEPPPAKFMTDRYEARARRLADPLWWRRALRRCWSRKAEESLRRLGVVRKGKCTYVSDSGVHLRGGQKRRMQSYLESHVASNELGEQLNLFDVQQGSVANPSLRRGELMTRVRGFEELADWRGDIALFFTLTTPSHFHPQLASGGRNDRYDTQQTARTAQAWLCRMWARARAKLHRQGVRIYGFRVSEPHHDGTPHWHGLFFVAPDQAHVVRTVVRDTWLSEHGDEPGAIEHRCRVVAIDKSQGDAAGYIAKYVSKNIDGAGTIGAAESDESGESVGDEVARVDAWASLHGIRQFQQIGGPPVGLWREARRLREETEDLDIERCRRRADRGDVCGFIRCVSWDHQNTRKTSLRLWKEEDGTVNKYGECRGKRIVGVRFASAEVITRPHRWKIEQKGRTHAVGRSNPPPYEGIATLRNIKPGGASVSSAESAPAPVPLGPVAITVRSTAGGRRLKLVLGVGGAPPRLVYADDEGRPRDHNLQ